MKYDYEVLIDETYADYDDIDEFGSAFVWIGDGKLSCEYNLCLQGGVNCSAIYIMRQNENNECCMITDYDDFKHYEIDFKNANWEQNLVKTMYEFALSRMKGRCWE